MLRKKQRVVIEFYLESICSVVYNFVNTSSFIGPYAGLNNIGDQTIALGLYSANNNSGNNVIGIGENTLALNNGNHVLALGKDAGSANSISNTFIVSNCVLPSFASWTAASASWGIIPEDTTYLFYNTTTCTIQGVRR